MNSTDTRAGRGRRLGAAVIDFSVTGTVAFVLIWPTGIFENQEAYVASHFVMRMMVLLCGTYVLVNGWLLYKNGQTVGKRLLGIRIVQQSDNQLLPYWSLLLRGFVVLAALSTPWIFLLAFVDFLFIFTPSRRCLHDILVGSIVQRIAKPTA